MRLFEPPTSRFSPKGRGSSPSSARSCGKLCTDMAPAYEPEEASLRTDEFEVKTWRISSMSSDEVPFFNPPKTHEKMKEFYSLQNMGL